MIRLKRPMALKMLRVMRFKTLMKMIMRLERLKASSINHVSNMLGDGSTCLIKKLHQYS